MQRGKKPYLNLGRRLTEIRRKLQETVPEVSGAIELDDEDVLRFERGEERPPEDILSLLIDHYNIKDEDADELWELAGYNRSDSMQDDVPNMPTFMVVPMDNRIVYTDTAHVSINNYGVVINFMQNGMHNQPVAISRVGMSMEHAKSLLEVLSKTIQQAEASAKPKALPAGRTKKASNKKQNSQ